MLSSAGFVSDDDRGNRSGISNFLTVVDFSGWVATSYNHRLLDNHDQNQNTSFALHPDANTFALDQVWFEIDKAPTEASRAGFHVDLNWGTANRSLGGQQNDNLYSAYVSYLADVGNGVQVDMGILPTLLGAEVAQQNANFNITRGMVWGLQPITHTGVILSTELGGGLSGAFGVVNDVFSDTSSDVSRSKSYTGQLAYSGDSMMAAVSYIVGSDTGQGCTDDGISDCNTAILDFLLTADPSDSVSMWVNLDWVSQNGDKTSNTHTVGVAAATRIAINDRAGIAGRIEFVAADIDGLNEVHNGSLTVTSDCALTDNLTARAEARWDRNFKGGGGFPSGKDSGQNNRDDVLALVLELLYSF
ncbi:MAG: outer membrane beta-barrel protein [Myxococcota bacterium]